MCNILGFFARYKGLVFTPEIGYDFHEVISMELSGSVTIENSFESSNKDMGRTHTLIHSKQHNFLQDGEPLVEELTNTTLDDDGIELAIKKLQELGIRNENQWEKYNKGQARERKKASYADYLRSLGSPIVKGKKLVLAQSVKADDKGKEVVNTPHTNASGRKKLQRELQYIEQNQGIPIWSALIYVGSADDYIGKKPDEIKTIRGGKADALRNWHNSKEHQLLHPGEFRAEIHYDEAGDVHDQSQEVVPYVDGRNRQMMSLYKYQEQNLIAFYGGGEKGEETLERNLDLLCASHRVRGVSKGKGSKRADTEFIFQRNALKGEKLDKEAFYKQYGVKNKINPKERRYRIAELTRIEDMEILKGYAKEAFKARGIDWTPRTDYATDGNHQTGPEYKASFDKRVKLASQSAQIALNDAEIEKTTTDKKNASSELAGLNASIKAKKDEKKKLDDSISSSHKTLDDLTKQCGEASSRLQSLRDTVRKERLDREKEAKEYEKNKVLYQKREEQLKEKQVELDAFTSRVDAQSAKIKENEAVLSSQRSAFNELKTQWNNLKSAMKEVSDVIVKDVQQSMRLSLYKVYTNVVTKIKGQAKSDAESNQTRTASEIDVSAFDKRTVHEALDEADTSKLSPDAQKLAEVVKQETTPKKNDVDRVLDMIYSPEARKRVNDLDHLTAEVHKNSTKVSDDKPKATKEKDQGPTL